MLNDLGFTLVFIPITGIASAAMTDSVKGTASGIAISYKGSTLSDDVTAGPTILVGQAADLKIVPLGPATKAVTSPSWAAMGSSSYKEYSVTEPPAMGPNNQFPADAPKNILGHAITSSTIVDYTQADFENASVSLHWYLEGTYDVTAFGTVIGIDHSVSTEIRVELPDSSLASQPGQADLVDGTMKLLPIPGKPPLQGVRGQGGIDFQGKVAIPARFGNAQGDWELVQVGHVDRVGTYHSREGKVLHTGLNRHESPALDGTYPYAGPWKTDNVYHGEGDSPEAPLPGAYNKDGKVYSLQQYVVQDHFTMYLMFKAPGADSQWAAINGLPWTWGGIAAKGPGGGFDMAPTPAKPGATTVNPPLPTWVSDIQNLSAREQF